MSENKIRYFIKFQNYDNKLLIQNILTAIFDIKKNLNFVRKTNSYGLPPKIKYFCVLRSPFVDNVSREHLELRVFNKLVVFDIIDPKSLIIEQFYERLLVSRLSSQESQITFKKIKIKNT